MSAKINNDIQLEEIEVDANQEIGVFKVSDAAGGAVSYALIKTITFSTEVPPAPSVLE